MVREPSRQDQLEDRGADLGAVGLYWIPLGAGAHIVRVSGKVFEAACVPSTARTV